MISLKVIILAVAVLAVNTSPATDGPNQSPSSTKQLPSDPNRPTQPIPQKALRRKETSERVLLAGKLTKPEIVEPHRLSKRFISPRWSLKRSSHSPEASLETWSNQEPVDQGLSSRLTYYSPERDQDVLDLVLGYAKPKRFFGLLPAKEPRRKDLPPRLGEESAPRFARAFSFPDDPQDPPSVRNTLTGLLRNLESGHNYRGHLLNDYMNRHLLARSYHIDTPININNVDVDFGIGDDIYSNVDSAGDSSSDIGIGGDFDQDASASDVSESERLDDSAEVVPANRKEDLEKFKESLHKLLSHIQEIAQVEESKQN